MTDGSKGSHVRFGRKLPRCIGFILLAGGIAACVYLLSREAVLAAIGWSVTDCERAWSFVLLSPGFGARL